MKWDHSFKVLGVIRSPELLLLPRAPQHTYPSIPFCDEAEYNEKLRECTTYVGQRGDCLWQLLTGCRLLQSTSTLGHGSRFNTQKNVQKSRRPSPRHTSVQRGSRRRGNFEMTGVAESRAVWHKTSQGTQFLQWGRNDRLSKCSREALGAQIPPG